MCNRFPFVLLLGGVFAVPSVTASLSFEPLPCLECNRFFFVGLLGVCLCSSKRNGF
ncbi:MAG: hypothetical protein LBC75_01940 [Fibromonadaceae bacterium]|nr:hypothetical protein [Fibromonadaceae bacterium]